MREAFVLRVWRERLDWLREGIDELGAACDRIWATPTERTPPCR